MWEGLRFSVWKDAEVVSGTKEARKKKPKRRFMDAVKEDMRLVQMSAEDAEDRAS